MKLLDLVILFLVLFSKIAMPRYKSYYGIEFITELKLSFIK